MKGPNFSIDFKSAPREELETALIQALELNAAMKQEIVDLREAIAHLKGHKGRPDIKPSGLDKGTDPTPKSGKKGKRGNGKQKKTSKLTIDEDRIIEVDVPPGSQFKGYQDYIVQEIVFHKRTIRIRRQRWVTPDGTHVVAEMPKDVIGHFGPELQRFVISQYYEGQSTMPRIHKLLSSVGICISAGQVNNILTENNEVFCQEAQEVLKAGLQTACYISTDDTGARHKGKNCYCTQIGNDYFTYFATTSSKSRINFLEILRTDSSSYQINEAALSYLKDKDASKNLLSKMSQQAAKSFANKDEWTRYLASLKLNENEIRLATEAALVGDIVDQGLLRDAVILSDGARQFDVFIHALCWVHTERLINKLICVSAEQRRIIKKMRGLLWRYYKAIKEYKRKPSPSRAKVLRQRFDRIFNRITGFKTLDELLDRIHNHKEELLVALDRVEVPLHTNGSEQDIRAHVTKRKVSAGTKSATGQLCRDSFLGLMKTCAKLGVSFWDYLGDRITKSNNVPRLADIIVQKATAVQAAA